MEWENYNAERLSVPLRKTIVVQGKDRTRQYEHSNSRHYGSLPENSAVTNELPFSLISTFRVPCSAEPANRRPQLFTTACTDMTPPIGVDWFFPKCAQAVSGSNPMAYQARNEHHEIPRLIAS